MRLVASLAMVMMLGSRALAAGPALVGTLDAPALWQSYKQSFISPGGRVMDNANNGISHSEGQGYGMLLAVAADDPATFETLWTWTRSQLMLRADGLAAWRWDPAATPHVGDRNNASDGDLLITWALAEAGEAWTQPAYKMAALRMARAVVEKDIVESPFGPVLRPGVAGFSAADRADGPVVNLSYWIFPALARLDALTPDPIWPLVIQSGLKLVDASRFGTSQLPSDWIALGASGPKPAKGFPATFGYDAIRVPLYLAWAGLGDAKTLGPFGALFGNSAAPLRQIDVLTGQGLAPLGDSGYRAVEALTLCVLHGTPLPPDLREPEVDRYYPSTLRAMVLIAAHQTYPRCL